MDVWAMITAALDDVKVGYMLAMFAGYGLFRFFNRSTTSTDDGSSVKTFDDDNIRGTQVHSLKEEVKLVLVVRMDLKMGKGKVAAQCCHGAVAAYESAMEHPNLLGAWKSGGQKKITVKVDDEEGLRRIAKHARTRGLLTNTVHDAGRTQIAAGSRTVCAIGPAPSSLIDEVTGHLKLY